MNPSAKPIEANEPSAKAGWLGVWDGDPADLAEGPDALADALSRTGEPVFVIDQGGTLAVSSRGEARLGKSPGPGQRAMVAFAPALRPEQLGDPAFVAAHGLRFPYVTGSMANGIASVELVQAASEAGVLAFFGAAGKEVAEIREAIHRLRGGRSNLGFNLIHSPGEPALEEAVVNLYLEEGVSRVEASAYLDLTLPVVRYRIYGLTRDPDGRVHAPNQIVAKASRTEVAERWLRPPPERFLQQLQDRGELDDDQLELARRIPMADDLTAEADSGGHTDNRPALCLLPTLLEVRDRIAAEMGYETVPRIGLAGGIATPSSAAAAFSMGAAYVMTGSINQACVESGSSDRVREMLANTGQADVMMAPAADMFEMGVKLQVLKRGTMFPMRAAKLWELYNSYGSLEEIPAAERARLEKTVFRASFEEIWEQTRQFFDRRDPAQSARAANDPRHRMALVFRWYLGLSSIWANHGEDGRQMDYQVWCGPAMGAFNEWVKGSCLEPAAERRVATVALNLLYHAAVLTRAQSLRNQGVPIPSSLARTPPLPRQELEERLA